MRRETLPTGTVRLPRVLRCPPERACRAFLGPAAQPKRLPPRGCTALPRSTDRFDDSSLPGGMETPVELRGVACGTELSIVQSGIPEAIPVEMCYLGRQESLAQPARLVEA